MALARAAPWAPARSIRETTEEGVVVSEKDAKEREERCRMLNSKQDWISHVERKQGRRERKRHVPIL